MYFWTQVGNSRLFLPTSQNDHCVHTHPFNEENLFIFVRGNAGIVSARSYV